MSQVHVRCLSKVNRLKKPPSHQPKAPKHIYDLTSINMLLITSVKKVMSWVYFYSDMPSSRKQIFDCQLNPKQAQPLPLIHPTTLCHISKSTVGPIVVTSVWYIPLETDTDFINPNLLLTEF